MADLASPGHIRDMQQAVDPFFQLDKGPVIRKVTHCSIHSRSRRVFIKDLVPGVLLCLLDPHRHLLFFRTYRQHDDIDLIANLQEFVWMVDPTGPGKLTDMNQTLDTRFQLHKSTIGHHVDHLPGHTVTDRVLFYNIVPRVILLLLETERNLFTFTIDIEDFHLNFLVDRHHL